MSESVGSVRLHLPTGAGTLSEDSLGCIRSAYNRAVRLAQERLGLAALDVAVLDAPEEAIPEWGVGGYTFGPRRRRTGFPRSRKALAPGFELIYD